MEYKDHLKRNNPNILDSWELFTNISIHNSCKHLPVVISQKTPRKGDILTLVVNLLGEEVTEDDSLFLRWYSKNIW